MAIATGLISSLFSVALSGDVPFCQPQQFQCLHHGSTFVLLYTLFLSPLMLLHGFMEDLVTAVIAEALILSRYPFA